MVITQIFERLKGNHTTGQLLVFDEYKIVTEPMYRVQNQCMVAVAIIQ